MTVTITDVDVNWWEDYGNSPELVVSVDGAMRDLEFVYKKMANRDKDVTLVSINNDPWVRFVHIQDPEGNPNYCGALGGEYKLTDGTVFKSRSGWSSRAAMINRLYSNYVGEEIVDVVLKDEVTSWAGYAIKLSAVKPLVEAKGFYLVREERYEEKEPIWVPSTQPDKVVKLHE